MKRFTGALAALCAALALATTAWAQAPEKKKVTIAVGGKSLFYYLPLTVAERMGDITSLSAKVGFRF
jgi:NitT/TauT family transport system substrate-binding protein